MPRGIEQLTSLRKLDSYIVRKQEEVTTEPDHERSGGIELFNGLNLLEELEICCLENVRRPIDADRANLKGKSNIRKLELYWSPEDDEHRSNHDVVVLEALQPHPNLKELVICGFMGSKLSTWMGGVSSCLLNLEKMTLVNCTRCEQLPALGQLPHLRDLEIGFMNSVKRLGNEFYFDVGESSDDAANNNEVVTAPPISLFFPSLINLTLEDMISLEEWVAPGPPPSETDLVSKFPVACTFPLLEKMVIRECPKLTIAPTLFPSLKELVLSEKNGTREALSSITRGLTSLTTIFIFNLPGLIYFPRGLLRNNTCLRDLAIWNCKNFVGFDLDGDKTAKDEGAPSGTQLNSYCSLQRLAFEDCPVLQFLPDLQGRTTLRELTIKNCNELKKSLPNDPKCLSFIKHLDVDFWKE